MSYAFPPLPVIPATLPPNALAITGASGNYTLLTTDDTIICFNGGYGIYLPLSNTVKSKPYNIKLWGGAGPITIFAPAGESIDGVASIVLNTPYQNRVLIPWQGAAWLSI